MSCGLPHEVPCSEILDRVYSYLDHELPEEGIAQVRAHLDECAPCLREFGLEEAVKKLVHKCCGSEPAPDRKSTRLNSSHPSISYAVFCLKKKKKLHIQDFKLLEHH